MLGHGHEVVFGRVWFMGMLFAKHFMGTAMNEIAKPFGVPLQPNKAFWVIWTIELWERFGYYGVQAIIALYFVKQLGYTEAQSFYVFGSFSAFVYGFAWIGGWVGDKYLGAKQTLVLGVIVLTLSYAGLALADHHTIFYALAGIIIGNSLYKANSGSLVAKIYGKGDERLDGAMTYYYMAVNIGSMVSISLVPIIAQARDWVSAFWLCAIGLFLGLMNYFIFRKFLEPIDNESNLNRFNLKRLLLVISGSSVLFLLIARLLEHTKICNLIVYTVVSGAFIYFLKIAFSLKGVERSRMLVAFVLIIQAVLFFVLYNQMPTSLTFFADHNINNNFLGWNIPAAEYQVLNPIVIVFGSPILVFIYNRFHSTHVTKFCVGMALCAAAFLVLAIPQYVATDGLASPMWMVLTYLLQSLGELLIAGLGLAMVAELCPTGMSGFVMGIWFLTSMLAGPLGAWVGAMTVPPVGSEHLTAIASMHLYGTVFLKIGLVTAFVALLMWLKRPWLNRFIN